METPRYELEGRIAEILAAVAVVLVAGLLLWPPGAVYWTAVVERIGESATLVAVGALAVALGAWVGRTATLALVHVGVGGLLAYAVGMAAIEVALAPDSPSHLVWYAVLLGCLLAGVALWRGMDRLRARRE